ncbi:Thoeris anti-defense Tad2 family protein [Shimia sp.]|uniref:Thoeris anti-defense Tad2 family protein n=1 Tax=Shimia sp. TaxID=1954381 RepID=UPI003BAD406B
MANLNFGQALEALKEGKRVARAGWNGKGMWLALVAPENYLIQQAPYGDGQDSAEGDISGLLPWVGMRTVDGRFVPWLASQSDILAGDWEEVEALKVDALHCEKARPHVCEVLFEPGDVVRLNSGSPSMTIEWATPEMVGVAYFSKQGDLLRDELASKMVQANQSFDQCPF